MGKGKLRTKPETNEEWEHLKAQSGKLSVDVYTKWAGPCDIMKPVINKMKIKEMF